MRMSGLPVGGVNIEALFTTDGRPFLTAAVDTTAPFTRSSAPRKSSKPIGAEARCRSNACIDQNSCVPAWFMFVCQVNGVCQFHEQPPDGHPGRLNGVRAYS